MPSWIEDYAMIGDGRTAALVSRTGSIDWLCLPRFDSEACFAALLGNDEHGCWCIAPCDDATSTRRYVDDTLVLQTEFTTATGRLRLTDWMAIDGDQSTLIRRVEGVKGSVRARCEFRPRFDYGLIAPRIRQIDGALLAVVGPDQLALRSPVALGKTGSGCVTAEFIVAEGQALDFVLRHGPSHRPPPPWIEATHALDMTIDFWRDWAGRFKRKTCWRGAVVRSLLTMKALTYHPTGAIVAAATTSLGEVPEGSLNWDYRYCWLRDASFTLSALLNAGFNDEAIQWRDWMLRTIACDPDKMRIMYRVDGGRRIYEQEVPWLPGHEGAAPVRVGNNAAAQRQVDVVGELLDALDLIGCAGLDQPPEALAAERLLVEHLEKTWQDKGHGLWETRDESNRYTYSVVMAWVGVDRFIRGVRRRGDGHASLLPRMQALRARIRAQVLERCWNHARGHFVDRFGGQRVDASLLLLPLVNFLPADEPRMSATIDAIERELCHDGLIWRKPEGIGSGQGAFIACSCWLADCRAMQGRRDEAVALFERVLSLRNDVGLLSEEYHAGLRRLTGNFPQTLSHLALVNTALGLSGPVLQRGGG